ncbi:MAG TPA: sel1 repeat family protein [Desulfobacterales bacterium]|nr:sel1 repeat family protein [Desulfobacterales bacterium]HIP39800.1 sel1 repeat family protein [Desulfocapsa sulfexigens]
MPLVNPFSNLTTFVSSILAVTPRICRSNGFFCIVSIILLVTHGLALADSYEAEITRFASAGDPQSQFALALLYEYGSESISRDPEQALFWLEKAGQESVAGACLFLGMKYEYGNRVKQDLSKAACWYTCAARQNWPVAQFFLAGFYERGRGVTTSLPTALAWYGLAADYGYPGAEEAFSRILKATDYDNMEQLLLKQEKMLKNQMDGCN